MPRYLVETLYQTPTGNANGHSCEVEAPDAETAIELGQKHCRRERRVMKIDGGDVTLISDNDKPAVVPVPDPDEKLPRQVYSDLAARLGMRVGTYSESSATFEAFEDGFDPRRTVNVPGWLAARMMMALVR